MHTLLCVCICYIYTVAKMYNIACKFYSVILIFIAALSIAF